MPELAGFQVSGSGLSARDLSPDSVIFTAESSNFSLFSSASASVERCSFASDLPDQDSVASHLAGHELSEALSGPDPDPNKPMLVHKNSIGLSRRDKTKVQKVDSSEADTTEDENTAIGSARNSFSQALKECQDRKLRSGTLLKNSDRRRPVSLDLNNPVNNSVNSSSPRLRIMKKHPAAPSKAATFLSPGTPNYRQPNFGIQKGWSSERVPLPVNASRRNSNNPLLSYNNNVRTLPSKWEDAERWIFSPVSGDGALRTGLAQQTQRRPKSKSGPLGPPGLAYYQMFSPAVSTLEAGGHGHGELAASSLFSSGLVGAGGSSTGYGGCEGGGAGAFFMGNEPCMARSISIHGCSELVGQSSLAMLHPDGKHGAAEEDNAASNISRVVSRRDMATQMSPDSSSLKSSQRRSSSFSEAILPVTGSRNNPEIRDVPIDEHVTMTRWSKKNKSGSRNSGDWKRKAMNIGTGGWEARGEASKSISKIRREEAKIMAWENLQKAKAEAAIRKLEMKLEKKRTSSMDKIMNKLRSAQKKAQEMRNSVLAHQGPNQTAGPSDRTLFFRRARPIGSLSGCFSCHVF